VHVRDDAPGIADSDAYGAADDGCQTAQSSMPANNHAVWIDQVPGCCLEQAFMVAAQLSIASSTLLRSALKD